MQVKKSSGRGAGICTILAAGDTSPPAANPASIFSRVQSVLAKGDIRICQTERVFSQRGRYNRSSLSPHSRRDPACAEAYRRAGFDVVTTAGNHSCDWGAEGVIDTVRTLEQLGIQAIGSGMNIARARRPAIVERNGVKVGFLSYASVILPQYWATADQAGVAPLRVDTYYEPYEYQPGCPARIITIPNQADVDAMQADIQKLRSAVHCVVVSHHWGVHGIPKPLAQYQPVVARAAVEAGADVVLGHHTHCLQGVEILKEGQRNAIVFYSLGNFAMPTSRSKAHVQLCAPMESYTYSEAFHRELEPGHRDKTYERFWQQAGIAKIIATRTGIEQVSFIPTLASSLEEGQPVPLSSRHKKFKEIQTHLRWASEGFTRAPDFRALGNELRIYAGKGGPR